MYIDNAFKIALLISLGVHATGLLFIPGIRYFTPGKKFDKIEIVYIKPKVEPRMNKAEPVIKNQPKTPPPPYVKKEEVAKENLLEVNKPQIMITQKDSATVKTKISVPPVNSKEIRNPEYLSYYQIVRERIKKAAYQNYTRQDTGEVYLSFAIASSGLLQAVRLIEEKSAQNQYLREVGLRSIENASPFPPFPEELNYPELSFNIIISFEAEK